jgi:hypothetical protein
VDDFGRCAQYSKTSDQTEYRATEERYFQDDQVVAAQVWDDFCKVHWPELYYKGTSWKDIPFRKENYNSDAEKQTMDRYGVAEKKRSLIHVQV